MKKISFQSVVVGIALFLLLTGVNVMESHAQGGASSSSSSASSTNTTSSGCSSSSPLTSDPSSSAFADGELLLRGLDSPEDSLHSFLSFVTSKGAVYANDGIREIWQKTPIQYTGYRKPKCHFMGIALGEFEAPFSRHYFVLGTEDRDNPDAKKYLFVLTLDSENASPFVLKEICRIDSMALPRNLVWVKESDTLYVVDSGPKYRSGCIYRIGLEYKNVIVPPTGSYYEPFVTSIDTIQKFIGFKPSALQVIDGSIYVALNPVIGIGKSEIRKYSLTSEGLLSDTYGIVYSSRNSFVEDFQTSDGYSDFFIADSRKSKIIHLKYGVEQHSIVTEKPTSVEYLQLRSKETYLFVTESLTGRFFRYDITDWFDQSSPETN